MTRKPVMLLADDDPDDQYVVRSALNQAKLNVNLVCVANGQELIDYIEGSPPFSQAMPCDLILLDLNMPVLDGKETIIRLKQSKHYGHIPIVIYTTSQSEHDVEQLYRLGAASYVVKPGDIDELVNLLRMFYDYWFKAVRLHH